MTEVVEQGCRVTPAPLERGPWELKQQIPACCPALFGEETFLKSRSVHL